ncbi:MAG: phosphohistidine phosphatase SixA [Myxococcota bacterium]
MDLYVLRHSMAVERGRLPRDSDRPLTEAGQKRLERATQAWDAIGVSVELVVTSPLLRAQQSATIAAAALGISDRIHPERSLAPGASPAAMVRTLDDYQSRADRIMLVGHEPDLGRLVSTLVCGNDEAGFRIKKAGLLRLSIGTLRAGRCATLEWQLWPRHLLKMS